MGSNSKPDLFDRALASLLQQGVLTVAEGRACRKAKMIALKKRANVEYYDFGSGFAADSEPE